MKISEVYDLETLINLFTYTGYVIEEDKWYTFVIHKDLNQANELYLHLTRGNFFQIGFNNNNFDYPILHHFLNHWNELKYKSGFEIAQDLYNKAQSLILDDNKFKEIADKNKYIFQIDLFTLWHYNNKARRASLKDIEFALNMENVQEMPIDHNEYCSKDDIKLVLEYNKNDVLATTLFYNTTLGKTEYSVYKNRNKLALRSELKKMFNINCYNWPDVKIGEQLMLNLYCRETNSNLWDVKQLRTYRNEICLADCIPSWCNIKSKEFNDFLFIIKHKCIKPGSKDFSYSIKFHGIRFDFGLGGSHGCCKSGIYKSDNDWVIMDLDISSLYPSIAKSLNLYPNHLGAEFTKLYSQFIDKRIAEKHKPKNERNNALIEGYKLILNGTYGKSGEETSFLYDPLYTYKTTIAGQLFISMWAERMVEVVPELEFIQINTDGITIRLPKTKIDKIREVYLQLEKETGLGSEEAFYNQMIIRDVK